MSASLSARLLVSFFFVGNVFERGVGSEADVEYLFTLLTAFRRDRV
jgi:hypothetical protein